MKFVIGLLSVGLLSLWLVGCATGGRPYEDSKIAMIKRGVTTERQLVDWFGPPDARMMAPDGSRDLNWRFAHKNSGRAGSYGRLEVRLDADGKVISYSAVANPR